MKIVISNLAEGEHFYVFKQAFSGIETGDYILDSDVDINFKLFKADREINVLAEFSGVLVLPCDRCLENYEQKITGSFGVTFRYKDSSSEGNAEDENVFFINPETNFIDLTEIIRDYLILSVPMKRSPEEEGGFCTYCHKSADEVLMVNKNKEFEINPVWEKLVKKNNKK